jgi:hypothetical protein
MFVISSCNLRSSLSVADAHLVFTSCEFCPQKSRGTAAISRCRVGDAATGGRCQDGLRDAASKSLSRSSQQRNTDMCHKTHGLCVILLLMIHGGGVVSDVGGSTSDAPTRSGRRWQERMSAASSDVRTQGCRLLVPSLPCQCSSSIPIPTHRMSWCSTHCDRAESGLLALQHAACPSILSMLLPARSFDARLHMTGPFDGGARAGTLEDGRCDRFVAVLDHRAQGYGVEVLVHCMRRQSYGSRFIATYSSSKAPGLQDPASFNIGGS